MGKRIAAILTNYNMEEATNEIRNHLQLHCDWPIDYFFVDNGSDVRSSACDIYIPRNLQTTKGWLSGINIAKQIAEIENFSYLAFLVMITSAEPIGDVDYITPMAEFLLDNPSAVGIMPSLSKDSLIDIWKHMKNRNGNAPRRVFGLDSIFTLWRYDWLLENLFDPDYHYAWGTSEETSWKARSQGRGLYVHDGLEIRKIQDRGYIMDRMGMSSQERRKLGMENVTEIMENKYGENWSWKMNKEFVEDGWE